MFTPSQLQAISALCLAKADRIANRGPAVVPGYSEEFERQNRARLVADLRAISADALFLIDTPDCVNTMASLEQALDEFPDVDAVAAEYVAAASAHLASLSPERRAELDKGWAA